MKNQYRKLFSVIQIRKNEIQNQRQTFSQFESFIQLSSSIQSSQISLSSSSITTTLITSISQIRHYEIYQDRHSDIRNNHFESELRNNQQNFQSRCDDRHESNRTRTRQYDLESNNYAENYQSSQSDARNFSRNEYFAFESLSSSKKSYSKKLALLKKIYSYNDKFEITEDNFDLKLQIYINKCRRADISSHVYDKKADIMLKKEALTHYYAN